MWMDGFEWFDWLYPSHFICFWQLSVRRIGSSTNIPIRRDEASMSMSAWGLDCMYLNGF